jgi:Carbohydrate esterase, sialic acid-specific acetylesterase
MIRNFAFVLPALILALTAELICIQVAPVPRLQLFLLAGQSNMAGRGAIEPEDRAPHPRVWVLDRQEHWVAAVDPLHFDKPIAGVGPGRSFGIVMADAEPRANIGLVPVAVGGSPISSWEPGAVHSQTGSKPYDDAIQRIRSARAAGEFKAILWHQGESDSGEAATSDYKARLTTLIGRLRAEVKNPALPVLIGQLGRFADVPWSESRAKIDAIHRQLAGDLQNIAFVSSEGLVHKGDRLHFDSASARELGRRYAKAYRTMTQKISP